jgi:hypothetical protein
MNENKKGVLANKRKVASLKPSKPRNFVAKNAINAGAGAHKDKKKAQKQGDVKHKAQRIKEEVGDVVEASKEVVAQIKDIKSAAKGEARKGRKKQ